MAVAFVLFLLLSARERREGGEVGQSGPVVAAGRGSSPPDSAALRFSSSGRLPVALHGFQLGMSVADAFGKMSESDRAYNAPSSSQPKGNLWIRIADGPLVICFVSQGRMVEVSGWAEGISPDDEAAFRQSTIDQLGKPDREIDMGPNTSYLVWIDGDVRVRYTSSLSSDVTGARSAEVEIAAYPALLASDPYTRAPVGGKDYLRHLRRGWGEDVGELVHKPLPKGLRGDISLRMKPWQVRSAVPGIQIESDSEKSARGVLKTAATETDVDFWDGLVSRFCRTWYDFRPDQFPALHERLIEGLGEPTEILPYVTPPAKGPGEGVTWENTQVKVRYLLGMSEVNGALQGASVCLTDKELDKLDRLATEAKGVGQRSFRAAPKIRSFF